MSSHARLPSSASFGDPLLDPRTVDRKLRRGPRLGAGIAVGCLAAAVPTTMLGAAPLALCLTLFGGIMAAQGAIGRTTMLARGHWYLADGETRLDGARVAFRLMCGQLLALLGILVVLAWWAPVSLVASLAVVAGMLASGAVRNEARVALSGAFSDDLPQLRLSPAGLAVVRPGFPPWTTDWNHFWDARLIDKVGLGLRADGRSYRFPNLHGFPVGYTPLIALLAHYKENPRDRAELGDQRALARIAAWEAGDAASAT